MENIFVEFLPPWVETGLQPAFYDKESGTVLQQTARMYDRVNMLVRMFNKLSKNTKEEIESFEQEVNDTVDDYIERFNTLYNYVHDYFDNLDVQDEIDHKLDEMVSDGTMQEIIDAVIQPVKVQYSYDTVNSMKADDNLADGCFAETYGYYAKGDEGGAKYKITEVQPSGYYETLDSGLYAELVTIDSLNVKMFGAKGDGDNDDTTAIQNAINYAFEYKTQIKVPASSNYYKVTMPILLKNKFTNNPISGYWFGEGTKLVGDNRGTSKIVKIGNSVYTDSADSFVNNKNATIICSNDSSTGVSIEDLTICNFDTYDGTTATFTNGSYAIYGNVARSCIKNINTKAYKGIWWNGFSCLFENIVMSATTEAFHNENGTSNTYRFLYAPQCTDPYYIRSQYSTLMNCCADDCKGVIFNIGGIGLSLINCGVESPKAQRIIKIDTQYSHVSVYNLFMIRQTGDSDNNLALSDCSVFYITNNTSIDVDGIGISETQYLDTSGGNSSIFATDTTSRFATTTLKNIRYNKNYVGTSNEPSNIWATAINANCMQKMSTATGEFNYIVGNDGVIIPYIGGSNGYDMSIDEGGKTMTSTSLQTSKRIWLDTKTQYTTENDTNIKYKGRHTVGDIQLFNDPGANNALGLSIISKGADSWGVRQIPLVLTGNTGSRPTTNLFSGLMYFDTTLNKPIWYNGSAWKDATGATV